MARSAQRHRRGPRVAAPKPAGPHRICVGCRQQHPRGAMARLVRSPEGEVRVDRHLRAPGRGAHLCYEPGCLARAIKRQAFGRAFGAPAQATEHGLAVALLAAIEARLADGLALGRRARQTVSGAAQLKEALARGRVRLLLLADDAAESTAERLERAAGEACRVGRFDSKEALGRSQGSAPRAAVGVVGEALARRLGLELDRRAAMIAAQGRSPE